MIRKSEINFSRYYLWVILIFSTFFSCTQKKDNALILTNPVDSLVIFDVEIDSLNIITPGQNGIPLPKKQLAGKPKILKANKNVHLSAIPEKITAKKPQKNFPGKGSFALPNKININYDSVRTIVSGTPEIIKVKDPYIRDQNSHNFSSFGKLQGLKHDVIRCMIQDKNGNLWISSYGGGFSKYDGMFFTHFSEKEGLANKYVRSIFEDSKGNIWLGTDGGGVSKYDGISFTNYSKKDGLPNNYVLSVFEDFNGNLWFGTDGGGVVKFDGTSFTIYSKNQGLANNTILSIFEDKEKNLWFGTNGGGVSKFDQNSFSNLSVREGLIDSIVWSITQDKKGNMWFGTSGGVCKYNSDSINSNNETFTYFTEKEGLSNNIVLSILEDKKGCLWFSTYGGGVCKFDGKSFTHFTTKEGLVSNIIWCAIEDKSGNIWFANYGGGFSRYNGELFTHFTTEEGISDNTIIAILQDSKGNIWFGTSMGLNMYDGKSFAQYTTEEGLSNNTILSMIEDRDSNLWLGTDGGGVSKFDGVSFTHFTEKEGLSNNFIWSILEDSKGNIWFGTDGGGVSKFDGKSFTHFTEKEGLSNNYVWSILEDSKGNIWFGTDGGGVSKFDGKKITHYTEKNGLVNNFVWSIIEDHIGNLWFGTSGGVSKFDGKDFTNITENEGLPNNCVFGMLLDKDDNLWFGTRFGLSFLTYSKRIKLISLLGKNNLTNNHSKTKFPENEVFFKNYGYYDGFLGLGVNGGNTGKNLCQTSDGTIWIAANDRLTAYHPDGYVPDSIPPSVHLTGIELFGEPIQWLNLENNQDTSFLLENGIKIKNFEFEGVSPWYYLPEKLSLAFNNNNITFNFIGVSLNQSKKIKYQYMLEGMDENWSAITSRNYASYGNLSHGDYTFKVKAMNSEGYWSSVFSYKFEIRPPWWLTWWFRIIYISSAVLILFGLYRWRTASLRKRQKQLVEEVKKATAEINEKNEELNLQNEEIAAQRDLVTEQKVHIEHIHKEVTDSINYAKRIQTSALPDLNPVRRSLDDIFVLFKPKDLVSGDFYWYAEVENQIVLAVADCTGHGVPGAFMSMMGMGMLKEIVVKEYITQPDVILRKLRKEVIRALGQTGAAGEQKDGMDISLCSINKETFELQWSGANNPLLLVKQTDSGNREIVEIKPDRMPIAIYEKMEKFTLQEIQLKKGDIIYLIGDGYADQFGGPKGKKFMSKKLKELLLEISFMPMKEQHELLDNTIINWMNPDIAPYKVNYEQTDDITIMGIKI